MQDLTHAGGSALIHAGNRVIHTHYLGYGAGRHVYRVSVTTNGVVAMPIGDDDRSFGSLPEADAYRDQLAEALTVEYAGITDEALQVACADPNTIRAEPAIARLRAQMPADTSDTAARINADWDRSNVQRETEQAAFNAEISELLGRPIGGFKKDQPSKACPTHPQYPANGCPACRDLPWSKPSKALTDTVPTTTPRQVRPTMAGAHLAPPSAPMLAAINTHRDGIVYPGPGVRPATLNALDRKGYGLVRYEGARKRIVALVLNGRGLALVGVSA